MLVLRCHQNVKSVLSVLQMLIILLFCSSLSPYESKLISTKWVSVVLTINIYLIFVSNLESTPSFLLICWPPCRKTWAHDFLSQSVLTKEILNIEEPPYYQHSDIYNNVNLSERNIESSIFKAFCSYKGLFNSENTPISSDCARTKLPIQRPSHLSFESNHFPSTFNLRVPTNFSLLILRFHRSINVDPTCLWK